LPSSLLRCLSHEIDRVLVGQLLKALPCRTGCRSQFAKRLAGCPAQVSVIRSQQLD
jgi:hypothetical protein